MPAASERGDRVAIVLPQTIETVVAHLAIHKLGAVSLPLAILFGPEALEYRLRDSGACAAIVHASRYDDLRACNPNCRTLRRMSSAAVLRRTRRRILERCWRAARTVSTMVQTSLPTIRPA